MRTAQAACGNASQSHTLRTILIADMRIVDLRRVLREIPQPDALHVRPASQK
jgi:hypothetical protein